MVLYFLLEKWSVYLQSYLLYLSYVLTETVAELLSGHFVMTDIRLLMVEILIKDYMIKRKKL